MIILRIYVHTYEVYLDLPTACHAVIKSCVNVCRNGVLCHINDTFYYQKNVDEYPIWILKNSWSANNKKSYNTNIPGAHLVKV